MPQVAMHAPRVPLIWRYLLTCSHCATIIKMVGVPSEGSPVNVISRQAIRKAQRQHPDATEWLENWWLVAKTARWRSLRDARVPYPATDQVGQGLVFNVRGNKYRFIVGVRYATEERGGTLFIKQFLTHAEYDKGSWKGER